MTFAIPLVTGPEPIIKTYLGFDGSSGLSSSSHTFSAMSFGVASPDRYIVACLSWITGGAPVYSSCTIGGVLATKLVEAGGSNTRTVICIAAVPTGASGNVVLNLTAGSTIYGCSLYSIKAMASPTPVSSGTDTTSPLQASLDIPAGGSAIAVTFTNSTNDAVWTNVSEDVSTNIGGLARFESASADFTDQQTALNVQAVQAGNCAFCAVSFGP